MVERRKLATLDKLMILIGFSSALVPKTRNPEEKVHLSEQWLPTYMQTTSPPPPPSSVSNYKKELISNQPKESHHDLVIRKTRRCAIIISVFYVVGSFSIIHFVALQKQKKFFFYTQGCAPRHPSVQEKRNFLSHEL